MSKRIYIVHILLIAGVALALYAHTLNTPFQWDGKQDILNNPFVTEKGLILEPSRASGHFWYEVVTRRYTGFLSFAVNHAMHGSSPTGYHVFNIAVHVMNSLLVYFMALLLFMSPALKDTPLAERSGSIGFWAALIFAAHPVQTEAVTYIFQRHASLVGLFYLGSVVSYLRWRSSGRIWWYVLALSSAILAMKTKENAFTLPLMIVLIEFLFFSLPKSMDALKGKRLLWLVPILLTMLIIPLSIVGIDRSAGEIMAGIGEMAGRYASLEGGGREYLLTQVRVVATYLRLFIFPVNQNIDYDYPTPGEVGALSLIVAGCLHLLMWLSAGYLLVKGRRSGRGELTLIGFGIVWFYLALSVESSVIKIPMVINEYRMYVPLAGLAHGASVLMHEIRWDRLKKAVLVVLIVSLAVLTVSRNDVWSSRMSLWEDVVRKSPHKARGHNNLGNVYRNEGLTDKAIEHYKITIEIKPDYADAHFNLGNAYKVKGLFDKAINHYQVALKYMPDFAQAHNNLGGVYWAKGLNNKAIEHFERAIMQKPDYATAHNNLGVALSKSSTERAIEHFERAIMQKPDYTEAHFNLGNAYKVKGLFDKAIKHYQVAIKQKPEYVDAHYNLGLAYLNKGHIDNARKAFKTVLQINPNDYEARQLLDHIANSR